MAKRKKPPPKPLTAKEQEAKEEREYRNILHSAARYVGSKHASAEGINAVTGILADMARKRSKR